MAIKSIDLQSMYPRTNDITKINNDLLHKNLNIDQQQAKSTKDLTDQKLEQVNQREKAQEAKIREEKRRDSQKKKKQKHNGEKEKGKKELNKENKSTIDIKI